MVTPICSPRRAFPFPGRTTAQALLLLSPVVPIDPDRIRARALRIRIDGEPDVCPPLRRAEDSSEALDLIVGIVNLLGYI
jgi:hypothetical protein